MLLYASHLKNEGRSRNNFGTLVRIFKDRRSKLEVYKYKQKWANLFRLSNRSDPCLPSFLLACFWGESVGFHGWILFFRLLATVVAADHATIWAGGRGVCLEFSFTTLDNAKRLWERPLHDPLFRPAPPN